MGACGIADSRVLTTLASMSWQPVSVRLISKVTPTVTPTGPPLPGRLHRAPDAIPQALRTGARGGGRLAERGPLG